MIIDHDLIYIDVVGPFSDCIVKDHDQYLPLVMPSGKALTELSQQ